MMYDYCGHSSRMVELVQLLLKSNAANSLIEDYAACLELRSEESQIIESANDDPGVLIMQVSQFLLLPLYPSNLSFLKLHNLMLYLIWTFAASN